MAVPKRRTSKARKRKRRSHHALPQVRYNLCNNCGEPVLPHRVCRSCGYYKGKPVIKAKED